MPYIMKPRVKTPSQKSAIQNPYWRTVLSRARAADHRVRAGVTAEPVFSEAAKKRAAEMIQDDSLAELCGEEASQWAHRFARAVLIENNPYAAYHSMRHLEENL